MITCKCTYMSATVVQELILAPCNFTHRRSKMARSRLEVLEALAPIFRDGGTQISGYGTLLSLPNKVHLRVLEWRRRPIVHRSKRSNAYSLLAVEQWTCPLHLQGCLWGHGSLSIHQGNCDSATHKETSHSETSVLSVQSWLFLSQAVAVAPKTP